MKKELDLIRRIGNLLRAPLIVRTYTTPSIQYAANQATWIYAKNWHAPTVDGYTPIGVLQATPNSGGGDLNPHIMIDYETYGDRLAGEVRNVGSAVTITMIVPILYIRNDLYGGVLLNLNIIKAFSHLQRLEVAA